MQLLTRALCGGKTTIVNSTTVTVNDNIVSLANDTSYNDLLNRGIEFKWYDPSISNVKVGFMGYMNTGKFGLYSDLSNNEFTDIEAKQIIANTTTLSPFVINSTALVANLNADYLNNQPASFYQNATNINNGTLNVSYVS